MVDLASQLEYDRSKSRKGLRERRLAAVGRDIGPLPAVVDPERKAACARSLRKFCESYCRRTFALEWSPDHLKVIAKLERCILEGGQFAIAMPRGSGKTSLCEAAALWALLYGHRKFVFLLGSADDQAHMMLDSITTEIEVNDDLFGDFPEVCHPIRELDGITNRCAGQIYAGERTQITWTQDILVFPTIAGSVASGAVVRVRGIEGGVRGAKFRRPDGQSVRPDLVILDDPQTDESAPS